MDPDQDPGRPKTCGSPTLPVTVAEVQAPELEVAIRAAGGNQRGVAGNVHGGDRELVAVQREEELQRVHEEDLKEKNVETKIFTPLQ